MVIGNYDISTWGVVSTYTISPPKVRIREVEVPGRSGTLDATEALTGYPLYDNREIEVVILIVDKTASEFDEIFHDIYSKIHGRRLQMRISSSDAFYYIGRWSVEEIVHEHRLVRTVRLSCNADPYLYSVSEVTKTIAAGSLTISSVMPTSFKVVAATQTSITRNGVTTIYPVGTTTVKYPPLVGTENLTINSGTGQIKYTEGKL